MSGRCSRFGSSEKKQAARRKSKPRGKQRNPSRVFVAWTIDRAARTHKTRHGPRDRQRGTSMPVKLPLPTSPAANIRSLLPTSSTSGGCTLVYASHARWPLPKQSTSEPLKAPLQTSVVDSSFNPPHAAHLALAQHGQHDAHLLALTIANPDKGSIDQDAVTTRLEMMRAVARDLERRATAPDGRPEWGNVAVAVLRAPTFVEKSEMLRKDLDALAQAQAEIETVTVRLTFGVGQSSFCGAVSPGRENAQACSLCSTPVRLRHFDPHLCSSVLPTAEPGSPLVDGGLARAR